MWAATINRNLKHEEEETSRILWNVGKFPKNLI